MTAPEPPAVPSSAPLSVPRPGPSAAPPQPPANDAYPATASPVAAAVALLDGVHQVPLHEQPDLYQAVHTELQNALAAIDDA